MKLHRLELTGFGPFRERQVIDFDAFDGDGLFLISGRTGAGKSSILDGVSFALYGSVPRYEGGDRRLRSDHSSLADATEVRLEFTVGATRWRISRAPEYERPAKRGGGVTLEPARAELEELVDGIWIGRAAKQREVGQLLDEVLGLSAQQFQQVILLAQNKFSRFLLAGNAERQQLLRTLFGTRRFEQYKETLEQRRRDAQKQVDEGGAEVRTLLDVAERDVRTHGLMGDEQALEPDLPGRRAALERAIARADYRVEVRANERTAAEGTAVVAGARHRELTARAQRLADLAAARADLAAREGEAPAIAESRERLARAAAAEAMRASVDAAERAAAAFAEVDAARVDAEERWIQAGGDSADELADVVQALTGAIARAEDAVDAERRLADLDTERRERGDEIAALEAALADLGAQLAAVPPERAAVQDDLTGARTAAARLDDLTATRAQLASQLGAARTVARLEERKDAAAARYLVATEASTAASAAVSDLLRRRLRGYAGELAAALSPGEACAVCGSVEHPSPASPDVDAVTDDDLASAEAARDAAAGAERAAGTAAAAAREALAVAVTGSGGREVEALSVDLAAVETELVTATAADGRVDALIRRLDGLAELEAAGRREQTELAARLAAAREEHAAGEATRAALTRDVAGARGEHESVAARLESDSRRRRLAQTLLDARQAAADRARVVGEADADLAARIAASDFADVAEVVAALLPADVWSALEARVAAHAAALTAARARTLELELDTVDLEVDDEAVAAAAQAAIDAEAARSAAIAAAADAALVATSLHDLLARIDAAAAEIAAKAEEAAAVTRLADTVAGRAPNTMKMDLETFVLAAELEEIVSSANLRLAEMSSGRYTLQHSDARQARGAASGLSIEVLDAHTGRSRSPQSLSGGETFLASLALALGLAEVVTSRAGGIRLDTLFIDEGFGSLDPETLELAMRTLDELRAGGRVVGVISHVETMKEQIPAQLVVQATPEGPSVVRQSVAS
ncbi:AAA family ATPase [Microbacterium sp. 179-B 1A2 NHS]|uniref:AAA family ATPase n=1 Tax=Microbacterium sp. 179-B 1A2 NHS TaxID=3142383 RepID=UPI0039A084A0